MADNWTDPPAARALLARRLAEAAPARLQIVAGPRQVGKTTLLLDLARDLGHAAHYVACDDPAVALPGAWDRLWDEAEARARRRPAVLLLDEIQYLPDWARRLKARWDRLQRERVPLHVVATGSSALRLGRGSPETLAGRFERLVLAHWSPPTLAQAFDLSPADAALEYVLRGAYPGAFAHRTDPARWRAYVRDAIVEPAIGRDLLALRPIRRPSLLRQVFAVAVGSPAEIVSLQKLQGTLGGRGALETIAEYLRLLEEAFLVAPLAKYSPRAARRRAAPPKLVTLNSALLAATDPEGPPDPTRDRARFGRWLENACLARAWNAGEQVTYWREEPLEVDGVVEGRWGRWAIEITTGRVDAATLRGLLEFCRRYPGFRPLVVTEPGVQVRQPGVAGVDWVSFLTNPPLGEPAPAADAPRA
ncbi:MAG TPA: AAA family ATPase [Vicinamibacterales bacterium]|nr:AAA family ATPase [Vicinamibacterales bacterium]